MKSICRYLSLPVGLALCIQLAHAQNTFDVNIGFGAVQDKASATGIDQISLLSCSPATDTTCSTTPSLSGFMLGFGGRVLFWKHFGIGGEVNLQPAQQTYVNLQPAVTSIGQPAVNLNSRVIFYDFDGIYQPIGEKRVALQLEGGIGGANMRFYETSSGTNALVCSSTTSQYAASSQPLSGARRRGREDLSHRQPVHPAPVRYPLRPNFTQFGSNLVTEETVWLGYSLGER